MLSIFLSSAYHSGSHRAVDEASDIPYKRATAQAQDLDKDGRAQKPIIGVVLIAGSSRGGRIDIKCGKRLIGIVWNRTGVANWPQYLTRPRQLSDGSLRRSGTRACRDGCRRGCPGQPRRFPASDQDGDGEDEAQEKEEEASMERAEEVGFIEGEKKSDAGALKERAAQQRNRQRRRNGVVNRCRPQWRRQCKRQPTRACDRRGAGKAPSYLREGRDTDDNARALARPIDSAVAERVSFTLVCRAQKASGARAERSRLLEPEAAASHRATLQWQGRTGQQGSQTRGSGLIHSKPGPT